MATITSMSIKTLLAVAPLLPSSTSVMLRGDHGIGKSQIVRQIAATIRKNLEETRRDLIPTAGKFFPVIDRRLSQQTEGDIIGLPSTDGDTTRFNPPDWYKRASREPVCLFLDELNRATPEVMQAAFQIVLDRELNGWKLHPETRVFTAINSGAQYTTNEVDPALLNRFWVVDLNTDLKAWMTWANGNWTEDEKGDTCREVVGHRRIHTNVSDFIMANEKWLTPPHSLEPGSVAPTPRSWERLSWALERAGLVDEVNNEAFYHVCLGYLGTEASIAFRDFVKTIDAQVSPEDIMNKWPKVKDRVESFQQDRLSLLVEKVADWCGKNLTVVDDKQGKNLKAFSKVLAPELKVTLWAKMANAGLDKVELIKSFHKHLVEDVLGVFQVPMGPSGVGIMPNIPGILQEQQDKAAKK